MYIGVDVGGTKTLVAVLDQDGNLTERLKFPTPAIYDEFLSALQSTASNLINKEYTAGAIALPGRIDREHGRGINLGNLAWRNVPMQHDAERIFMCPVVVENDAKLAALSETLLLNKRYRRVLYMTVSTGIGLGLVVNGKLDINIGDSGGRALLLEHEGKLTSWEEFAGGRAIVKRYRKKAQDITSKTTWKRICHDLARGLAQYIAITEPDVIIIGGSVGTYFDRYGDLLTAAIKDYEIPMVALPTLRGAIRPEEAVVYGCYELAKQVYSHAATHN